MNGDRTYSYAISSRRFLLARSCLNSVYSTICPIWQLLPCPFFAGRFVLGIIPISRSYTRICVFSLAQVRGESSRDLTMTYYVSFVSRLHSLSRVYRSVFARHPDPFVLVFLLARRSRVLECQRTVSSPFLAGLGALNAIYVIQARKHGSLLAISVKRGRKQGERTYAISNPLASLVRVPFVLPRPRYPISRRAPVSPFYRMGY